MLTSPISCWCLSQLHRNLHNKHCFASPSPVSRQGWFHGVFIVEAAHAVRSPCLLRRLLSSVSDPCVLVITLAWGRLSRFMSMIRTNYSKNENKHVYFTCYGLRVPSAAKFPCIVKMPSRDLQLKKISNRNISLLETPRKSQV